MRGKARIPPEMVEVAIIDRVGGLQNYRLLCEDARLYELFIVAMQGEAQAARERELEAEAARRAAKSRRAW